MTNKSHSEAFSSDIPRSPDFKPDWRSWIGVL